LARGDIDVALLVHRHILSALLSEEPQVGDCAVDSDCADIRLLFGFIGNVVRLAATAAAMPKARSRSLNLDP
jgi:hypothetical protein